MAAMTPIFTPKSMPPIGPYSQAMKGNGFVFVSGQMAADPETKRLTGGSVADETHQLCKNAAAVLEAAGSSLEKVVKVTVYFADLDDFQEFNEVYAQYFPPKPARSAIEAKRLPAGVTLELDLIALE